MFLLGKRKTIQANELDELYNLLEVQSLLFRDIQLDVILSFLEKFKFELLDLQQDYILDDKALLGELFSKNCVLERINLELGDSKALDEFRPITKTHLQHYLTPKGIITQVSANNVFLGVLDNIISTLVTKNILLLKVSSTDCEFIDLLISCFEKINGYDDVISAINFVQFKGGDDSFESIIKVRTNKLIVWGGPDTISSYSKNLGSNVELKTYGPRISFSLITKKYFDVIGDPLFERLAFDISRWGQRACSNVQNIYIEEGIDLRDFITRLSSFLDKVAPERSDNNCEVEILKKIALLDYEEFEGEDSFYQKSQKSFIFKEKNNFLEPTMLGHSVAIKVYKNSVDLMQSILPMKEFAQSCSLGALGQQRTSFMKCLSKAGVSRFTFPGQITESVFGAPHEGSYQLAELVDIVFDQQTPSPEEFKAQVSLENAYYQSHDFLESIDLKMDKFTYDQLSRDNSGGYYFASGATSGKPKISFYGSDEFDLISYKMCQSYLANGLVSSDRVLNLFFAGNMWSSFSAVQFALKYANVEQLPLGGNCSEEDFEQTVRFFRPNVVFGVPGVLQRFALYCKERGQDITFDTFFYAGERLTESVKFLLKDVFKIKNFKSAGFACVDTGIIGYQDSSCQEGEHILFNNIASLVIEHGVGRVTSLLRKNHPVISYALSDKVEWTDRKSGKFKLLGRVDNIITLWGARINFKVLDNLLGKGCYQIRILKDEALEIILSRSETIEHEIILKTLHSKNKDLEQTLSYQKLREYVIFTHADFIINARTGKLAQIIDER